MDFRAATLLGAPATFTNPLFRGADPWVARRDGWYYFCLAGPHGRLEVWKSDSPVERGHCSVVWRPPARGWNRAQVWAPELHFVGGRWHLYYAACDGRNSTHRMGVLRATTDDPQGPYEDMGQLYTGDDYATPRQATNRWAIDGTLLELRGRLYFIWSGWEDHRDVQHLYIAPMKDPCTIAGPRVQICPNDCHPWERVGEQLWERGLHEGPQVLVRGGRVFLVYSCSGSWQPTYKLGMLFMDAGDDPLARGSWTKYPRPVFESTPDVFGVGHCCFTTSPDGREDWILYHSKRNRWDCWSREVRAQPFTWRGDGFPDFGGPVPTGQAIALPSGCNPHVLPEAA
ncbi:MAG TPA: glycoside hydrolase family 43 protein [Tepidisphaeraceae bacterium]|nr:glycoside hydrolase family 43 protein [Tepidisphaeraceae bacterium]